MSENNLILRVEGYIEKEKIKHLGTDNIELLKDSLIDTTNLYLQGQSIKLHSINSIRESAILEAEKVDLSNCYIKTGKTLYIKAKEIDVTDARIDVPELYLVANTHISNNSKEPQIFNFNIEIASSDEKMLEIIKEVSIFQDQSCYEFSPLKHNNEAADSFLPAEIMEKYTNFQPLADNVSFKISYDNIDFSMIPEHFTKFNDFGLISKLAINPTMDEQQVQEKELVNSLNLNQESPVEPPLEKESQNSFFNKVKFFVQTIYDYLKDAIITFSSLFNYSETAELDFDNNLIIKNSELSGEESLVLEKENE